MTKISKIITSDDQYNGIREAFIEHGINIKLSKVFIDCWINKILNYDYGGTLGKELVRQARQKSINSFKNGEYKTRPITTLINDLYYSSDYNLGNNIYERSNIVSTACSLVGYGRNKKKFNKIINDILLPYIYYYAKQDRTEVIINRI